MAKHVGARTRGQGSAHVLRRSAVFTPIPAIDIRSGRGVRLLPGGSFAGETVYADDPVEMARRWESLGAQRIHVVDLDGAREGVRTNRALISRLVQAVGIPVQVGGGIRALPTAREILDEGADRVIVGTAAVERLDEMQEWVNVLGAERVVIGVDVRDGFVATHAWERTSTSPLLPFCTALKGIGVERILVTDIARDGSLEGPNLDLVRELVKTAGMRVLSSGGVASVDDLLSLAAAGAEGAIIGKALYEGRFTLAEAAQALSSAEARG